MTEAPKSAPAVVLDGATLARVDGVLKGLFPWRGTVADNRARNFLGVALPPGCGGMPPDPATGFCATTVPVPEDGETFFEWYSTYQSIEAAEDRYVAVSLGAHYGGPLVNAALLLRRLKPLPFTLVAVEADRYMFAMLKRHLTENGIDPADHWLLNVAVSDRNRPLPFTSTPVRTGTNFAMHQDAIREAIINAIVAHGKTADAVRQLIHEASTGITFGLGAVKAEVELVSTVTVADVLGPLPFVDYLEIDMQASELTALPPAIGVLTRKVRRIHLGTHSDLIHRAMRKLFRDHGWAIDVDLDPYTTYRTRRGGFTPTDGVLSLVNPKLCD
ncbi:MAG: hypothetical protein FJX61_04815 [Alphaproteobacteria bacterium]|nr:hypothetical protein [Alphaproteobacteria bacterium]